MPPDDMLAGYTSESGIETETGLPEDWVGPTTVDGTTWVPVANVESAPVYAEASSLLIVDPDDPTVYMNMYNSSWGDVPWTGTPPVIDRKFGWHTRPEYTPTQFARSHPDAEVVASHEAHGLQNPDESTESADQ